MKAIIPHSPADFWHCQLYGQVVKRLSSETPEEEKGLGCVQRLKPAPQHYCITLKSEADLFVWVGACTGVSGHGTVCARFWSGVSNLCFQAIYQTRVGLCWSSHLDPHRLWELAAASWSRTAEAIRVSAMGLAAFSATSDWFDKSFFFFWPHEASRKIDLPNADTFILQWKFTIISIAT